MGEPPGGAVRWRESMVQPGRLRLQLREVEGWPFEGERWNCQLFVEHFFDRILARGGAARLRDHLDELAARGAEIAGVLDVECESRRALVYKYRAAGERVVHLRLDFGEGGLSFEESE